MMLLGLVTLAGCGSARSIDNRTMLFALAFDKAKGGLIQVTGEEVNPLASPAASVPAPGQSAGPSEVYYTGVGHTVGAAFSRMQLSSPGYIDVTDLGVLLFNRALLRQGLYREMSYLMRGEQTRILAYALVASKSAAGELRTVPKTSAGSAYQQLEQAETFAAKAHPEIVATPMWKLYRSLWDVEAAALLPIVSTEGQKIVFRGSALVAHGRLVGALDPHMTAVLDTILRGEEGLLITVHPKPGQTVVLRVMHAATHYKLVHPETLDVSLTGHAKVIEMSMGNVTASHTDETLEGLAGQQVVHEVVDLMHHLQAMPADPFGIGALARARYPQRWTAWRQNWFERFRRMTVHVKVGIRIVLPS